jgi:hypothetical protein
MGVSDAFLPSLCSDGVNIADYLLFLYLIISMNYNYFAGTLSGKSLLFLVMLPAVLGAA